MSTPSSPFGSHDLSDQLGIDVQTTIATFEDDIQRVNPDLAVRVARIWQETLRQSDWPNAHVFADQWARLDEVFSADEVDQGDLADALLQLAEGSRLTAADIPDEGFSSDLERLAATFSAAAESLGTREVEGNEPRAGD
jgi:phytoene dehydrogenase-like protein